MSCCPDIEDIFTGFSPVSYENIHNVDIIGGELFRNGGVVGTSDAFADTTDWVDGTSCAMWLWRIDNMNYPPDDYESNLVNYFIYPEDASTGVDGWGFTNAIVSFRRSPFLNSTPQFPIFYRNVPLGFNYFAIFYNNGIVWLLETSEIGTAIPGWIGPPSYARAGLPTTTRYRLRVTVKNAPATCHSSAVTQFIGAPSPCGQANWVLPPLGWSAESMVTQPPGLATQRFDSGVGPTPYYIIPQLSDSGDELRAKSLKSLHVTGKLTNAVGMAYGYDVGENIEIADLESGENSKTGPIEIPDTTEVTLTERRQIRVPNAELHTVRIEGEWDGEGELDRIDEIAYEYAEKGVRR